MKSLSDKIAALAIARALRLCERPEIIDIEFPEIDLVWSVRPPSPAEWARYFPLNRGATRGAANYNLLLDCTVYPCDEQGEPDHDAIEAAVDSLPGLVSECVKTIDDLSCGAPLRIVDLRPENDERIATLFPADTIDEFKKTHPRGRVVELCEDSPVKAFLLRVPPRISWEAVDGCGVDQMVEAWYGLTLDCITSVGDAAKAKLLKYYPGLPAILYPTFLDMVGSRLMGTPRKKARRGSSGS